MTGTLRKALRRPKPGSHTLSQKGTDDGLPRLDKAPTEDLRFMSPYTLAWMLEVAKKMPELGRNLAWQPQDIPAWQWVVGLQHELVARGQPDNVFTKTVRDPQLHLLLAFLKKHGIPMELERTGDPKDIWLAAVIKALTYWKTKGTRGLMEFGGNTYDAVRMEIPARRGHVHVYTDPHSPYPVFGIEGSKKYMVFFQEIVEPTRYAQAMEEVTAEVLAHMQYGNVDGYTNVLFPMIDGKDQYPREWLIGLSATGAKDGGPAIIMQAFTAGLIQVNHKGAKGTIADVATVMRSSIPAKPKEKWYKFDHTGLIRVVFKRVRDPRNPLAGDPTPEMIFEVPAEHWGDPGDL